MPQIVTDPANLGAPSRNGAIKGVRVSSGYVEWLAWDSVASVWRGEQHTSMGFISDYGQTTGGSILGWRYPGDAREQTGYRFSPTTMFGLQIHKAIEGGELFSAGMKLQENNSGFLRCIQPPTVGFETMTPDIALAWYPLAAGEAFLTPTPFNFGYRIVGSLDLDVPHWMEKGWQPTPDFTDPPASSDILYPEFYMTGPVANIRQFVGKYRWVYGPGADVTGLANPWRFPASNLLLWVDAYTIPQADGTAVAEWTDFSGVGNTLKQATSANQPVVMNDGTRRFVRFDGSNDGMNSGPVGIVGDIHTASGAPIVAFLAMRQRPTGATQQMWLNTGGGGASMIYRNDTTDAINTWAGGGADMVAHGTDWSANVFKVYSVRINADGSGNVWENLTPIGSGNPGSSGFDGFAMGINGGGSLPAAIDVCEAIVCWRNMNDTERTSIVNALMAKHAIT